MRRKRLRHIEFYPPDDDTVHRFVHSASTLMAEKNNDQGYLDPEVVWGLAAFIKLVGEIKAKQLNETGSAFDSSKK